MTQPAGAGGAAPTQAPSQIMIVWAGQINEQGGPMRWLGSWLVTGEDVEGAWFYGGHGSERTEHPVPSEAVGVRVRRWISEGLDPEYVDVMFDGGTLVHTGNLDFDSPQPHRVLRPAAG